MPTDAGAATITDPSNPGPKLTWAIGVHMAADHLGPLRFAATMISVAPGDRGLAIHVLPDATLLGPIVTQEDIRAIREQIRIDVAQLLTNEGIALERAEIELVEDDAVDRGLSECVERLDVSALVVGRRAKRDDDPLIRLGEVTRRLLRRLPAPVVVVPPDFGDERDRGFGAGPIVVGVDLTKHCEPAVLFAADLARRLDRTLLLAHGTQAFHWGVSYVPATTIERLQAQAHDAAAKALREWAAPLGLTNVAQRVFTGDPAQHLLQIAAEVDAAMLVTGSRMLGPIERLFLASVSTEIAAGASCPVAVVPGSE